MEAIVLHGVEEYAEGMDVKLKKNSFGSVVIVALNEAGYNSTEVDLGQLLEAVSELMPDLYMKHVTCDMMRKYT